MNRTRALILAIIGLALAVSAIYYSQTNTPSQLEGVEIREYNGQRLSSITAFRENSIKGPQHIDNQSYRLKITGLVDEASELLCRGMGRHDSLGRRITQGLGTRRNR